MHKTTAFLLLSIFILSLAALVPLSAEASDADTGFVGPDVDLPCACHTLITTDEAGLLYAAGDGAGVFRSEDDGASWTPINDGLPSPRVGALAAAPAAPNILYATIDATPYRSDDRGKTWRQVAQRVVPSEDDQSDRTPLQIGKTYSLLAHPTDPGIVHALSEAFSPIGTDATALAWTTDGGVTWQINRVYFTNYLALTYLPGPAHSLIAAISDFPATAIQQSNDLGITWSDYGTGSVGVRPNKLLFADASVGYIVGAHGQGVYKSIDGGRSWSAINDGLQNTFVDDLVPLDADRALAATSGGGFYRYSAESDRWQEMADRDATPFSEVYELAVAGSAIQVFAATNKGIWSSADEGASWQPASGGLNTRSIAIYDLAFDAVNVGALWTATGQGLFLRNADGSWQQSRLPTGSQTSIVRAVATSASAPDTIFAGTDRQLYRSEDRGASWQVSSSGIEPPVLPNGEGQQTSLGLGITALAVSPEDPVCVYAGTTQGLFVSRNGGASWRSVPELIQLKDWPAYPTVTQIAIDPSAPDTIFVAVRLSIGSSADQLEIFKSIDGGANWRVPSRSGAGMRRPRGVAFDLATPGILHGAAESGLWRSNDGGVRWTPIGLAGSNVIEVTVLAGRPDTMAALTSPYAFTTRPNALQLSTDGGQTWTEVGEQLGELEFTRLFATPNDPTAFSVGTRYGGLYRLDLETTQIYLPIVGSQ